MDVAHLAAGAAGGVERLRDSARAGGREIEREAVFLETRDAGAEAGRVGDCETVQGVPHKMVQVRACFLVGLALRGDAGDFGAGAGTVGQGEQVGRCGTEVGS